MINILRCVDFECSGMDPEKDGARVIEIGWVDVARQTDGSWAMGPTEEILVDPQHRIPPETSGIHHITDDMVTGCPTFSVAATELMVNASGVVFCAHNAAYEKKFFTVPAQWIDTYRVAYHLAPKAPNHKLQTLRYFLKLELERDRSFPCHRAGPDAYVGAALLLRMLKKLTVEEMIEISSKPIIFQKLGFGMHADKPLEAVPTGYLRWILDREKHEGFDEDVEATARYHINQRQTQESAR